MNRVGLGYIPFIRYRSFYYFVLVSISWWFCWFALKIVLDVEQGAYIYMGLGLPNTLPSTLSEKSFVPDSPQEAGAFQTSHRIRSIQC